MEIKKKYLCNYIMYMLVKLSPIHIKSYVIFRIEIHRICANNKSKLIEKIGYYNTDPYHKFISVNFLKLGIWLNRGAKINSSVYKILRKYKARKLN